MVILAPFPNSSTSKRAWLSSLLPWCSCTGTIEWKHPVFRRTGIAVPLDGEEARSVGCFRRPAFAERDPQERLFVQDQQDVVMDGPVAEGFQVEIPLPGDHAPDIRPETIQGSGIPGDGPVSFLMDDHGHLRMSEVNQLRITS